MRMSLVLVAISFFLCIFNMVILLIAACWYDPIGAWLVWTFSLQAITALLIAPALVGESGDPFLF